MSNTFYKETEELLERYSLATERLSTVSEDKQLPEHLQDYFNVVADYMLRVDAILKKAAAGTIADRSLSECQADQASLFDIFSEDNYKKSYLCPTYAVKQLGKEMGGLLSAVFYQLTDAVRAAFAGRLDIFTIYCELILQIYGQCQMEEEDKYRAQGVEEAFYSFKHDYCQLFMSENTISMIDPDRDFYSSIIMTADLNDDTYMYRFGTYISDNELLMAAHLRSLPHEDIVAMASTYVQGYIKGFEVCGKDISKKETVLMEAPVGFELMTREAIRLFNEAGLAVTLRFGGSSARNLYSTAPNKQALYDHKDDRAYTWDKGLCDRMLEVAKNTFEKHKETAAVFGGPAVIETFGEKPFEPENFPANATYTDKQNELNVYYMSQNGQITNQYIKGEERSFTIIAYPIPEIGSQFVDIFNETVRVNTLDYDLYKTIQQRIIDVLDQGQKVHVTGRGANHTDIIVQLHHLDDPAHQTNFENCVADVNIPVGEVFTSPVLEGTEGVLHVTQVYLNELGYKNLELSFKDGKVIDYTCSNFASEEENKKYIFDNVLFKHDTLPIGEFAIGTNTTAFMMGQKYKIADKLPILIAEKTGPHFAVGDTCYSHSEDVPMYNPDGKECIARDNSCSILRKTDFTKAYFNCHTDITIPYYELGDITVITADGRELPIIAQGRFVVEGTEELNKALDE